jgi:membrane protease subunit HflK
MTPGPNDNRPNNPWGAPPPRRPRSPQNDMNNLFNQAHTGFKDYVFNPKGGMLLPGLIVLGIWLGTGVYFVTPAESAVIQRFGAWSRTQNTAGLGLHFPWPIEQHKIINTQLDRRIVIGFKGENEGENVQVHAESLMLTEDANIVDINVVVLWNIANAENYLFKVANPDMTIKQVGESALREAVGQAPLQKIITEGRSDVATRVQDRMQKILDAYGAGVSIKQVLIQEATVHPDVLEAFDDVVAARQDAERYQNEAAIYRNDIIPTARGEAIKITQSAEAYKDAQIAKAEGDARRFDEVYEAYKSGQDVTRNRLYIEAMESILTNAKTVVVDEKAGQGAVPILPIGATSLPASPSTVKGIAR